jgi:hypothetical protein
MTNEQQLLLTCARTDLNAAHRDRLANLLREPLNWPVLIDLAAAHGVLPLLYQALSRHSAARVPPAAMTQLLAHYQMNTGHNVVMTKELLRLLALLEQHCIPALPFKGPALASLAYGDLALRQFTDLDIVVRPQDLGRAKQLLETEGYRLAVPLNSDQQTVYVRARNQHHMQFNRLDGKILVELHWQIAPGHFFKAGADTGWWARQSPGVLAGSATRQFDQADLLLLQAIHGGKHCWERLGFVVDLAQLIRATPARNWPLLLARAGQLRCRRLLLVGVLVCHTLLETPLPPPLAAELHRQPDLILLAERLAVQLFSPTNPRAGTPARLRVQWHLIDRRRDRLAYGLALLTAPTVIEWQQFPLPGRLNMVYRLLRPARLARKYLARTARSLPL